MYSFRGYDVLRGKLLNNEQLLSYIRNKKDYNPFEDVYLKIDMSRGFKDVDNNPIFVNDIIQTESSKKKNVLYLVDDTMKGLSFIMKKFKYKNEKNSIISKSAVSIDELVKDGGRVVGNIHTSKDLLGG
jgi:hypothetical protein